MPYTLCYFFVSAGLSMDIQALTHSWPGACGLFFARLLSMRIGYTVGNAIAPGSGGGGGGEGGEGGAAAGGARPPPPSVAWLAFITQAGVGLGLAEEIGDRFAPWAEGLRTCLVASICLNQVAGPPLLRYALRASGETGAGPEKANADWDAT